MIVAVNLLALFVTGQSVAPPPPTAAEIVEQMVAADNQRLANLAGYTSMRQYHLENERFHKSAQMTVRVDFDSAGTKTFEVVAEEGSKVILHRVFRPMLEAESAGSRKEDRDSSRILPANYDFHLVGVDTSDGPASYILEISPKTQNKFLIRGRIWVDANDYAIRRIEGSPAKNPSFWTRSIHIEHRYGKAGAFWLPLSNSSSADVRIFGRTVVTIKYFDYVVRQQCQNAGVTQ
jgi:hypothetical protein